MGIQNFRPLPCAEFCISAWTHLSHIGGTLLDLVLTNIEELVRKGKVRCSLGCSDHQTVEVRILREGNNAKSRITTPDSRWLWPVQGPAWENLMGYSPGEEFRRAGWFTSITFSRLKNSSSWWAGNQAKVTGALRGWTSSSWVHSKMKRAYMKWKKGQVTQELCRNTVQACRDRLRKANTNLELKLVRTWSATI